MSLNRVRVGDLIKGVFCGISNDSDAPSLITAASTGDATEITGAYIDRQGFDHATVIVSYLAALSNTKSISIQAEVEHSTTGSGAGTAVELQASTVEATSDGGTNESGVVVLDVDLRGYGRYVRFNATPDLSNTVTDTAIVSVVAVLGNSDSLPVAN